MRYLLAPLLFAVLLLALAGCVDNQPVRPDQAPSDGGYIGSLSTDKARYAPGDSVSLTAEIIKTVKKGELLIQVKHLNELVEKKTVPVTGDQKLEWSWDAPDTDFRGYMVEVYLKEGSKLLDHANIAVDVSSDWAKFPRYGYLADFPQMTEEERKQVIERLNRFHINGIQFYDWQWKHHTPLKMEGGKVAEVWPDIANRDTSYDTVKGYIDLAHDKNMRAMNYNLLFGAYENAEQDGVKKEWGLFRDPLHENQDKHPLPDSWASDIYLMDPSNEEWLNYLFEQEKKVFELLPFDGWHVDQLGDRGNLYNYDGKKVMLLLTYADMLKKAKQAMNVDFVMNAVAQFGQQLIAKAPVDFLYTEVWSGHPEYKHLKQILDDNAKYSENKLNTVLAAYMNYDLADGAGQFNTPGVLLTDAFIFASGGAHLELGEHMLAKEYFPNKNLTIPKELEEQLVRYYDFHVAYQNLLRDGAVQVDDVMLNSSNAAFSKEPEKGAVWSMVKRKDRRDILHLINFTDASTMNWNDAIGTQTEPKEIPGFSIQMQAEGKAEKVWVASPDDYGGSPLEIDFEQTEGQLSFTVPKLKYWSMIVVQYER